MTVAIQYVVERKGVQVLVTRDKKEADAHDKMLDTAENLAMFLVDQGVKIPESILENLCITLSKNKDTVSAIFGGKWVREATEESPLLSADNGVARDAVDE